MILLRRPLLLLGAVFLIAAPVFVQASVVNDILRVADYKTVTRGEFIRASVKALDMESVQYDAEKELPYKRVPRALDRYIRIAYDEQALKVFGDDLLLAHPISRGEALQMLLGLTNADYSDTPATYKDVQEGTPVEFAVRAATELDWMEPIRYNLFGVRRKLTGKEARLTLRKVRGEAGQNTQYESEPAAEEAPKVRITIQTEDRLPATLPKSQILEAIWGVVNNEFLFADQIDPDEAAYKAAEGLIESLGDKYTTFLRPVKTRNFQTQIQGKVTGIGAQVEYKDEVLTIVTPLVGSPAMAAGIEPGDQILAVNGEPLAGLSFMEAVDRVRGPKGSTAKLRIMRNGTEFDVEVVRDTVKVPEAVISWQENIAVVQISQFGRVTETDLRPQMRDVQDQDPKGVILDLRNNPGGLLSAAGAVLSIFVPKGTDVVITRSREEENTASTSTEPVIDDDVKLVVLVNNGSASASEIVAGALQDLGRATVIGETTFGKGTVQQVLQFNDQSSLKMTIAEWFTPLGRKIEGFGIVPDIEVDEEEDRDIAMLKALELLR